MTMIKNVKAATPRFLRRSSLLDRIAINMPQANTKIQADIQLFMRT